MLAIADAPLSPAEPGVGAGRAAAGSRPAPRRSICRSSSGSPPPSRCGRFKDGEALPPERILSERLEVSRTTVRKALDELTARGLVTSRHGSGNFVAARLEQPLARLSSFSEDMRARGRNPGFAWVERGVFAPSPEEVIALALGSGEQVSRFVRVRLADDEPLAVERAAIAARAPARAQAVESSLYAALRDRGLEPVRALQHLRATAVGAADARASRHRRSAAR